MTKNSNSIFEHTYKNVIKKNTDYTSLGLFVCHFFQHDEILVPFLDNSMHKSNVPKKKIVQS